MPVVYVGTLAGRFVGVAAEGEAAGSIVVERFLGGMVWTRAESDGAVLYVGADDDVLYALDPVTGASLWELRLGDCEPPRSHGPEGTRCDVDGGPTLAPDGDLYVGADGVYRIARDGTVRWHYGEPEVRPRHVYSRPLWTPTGLVVFGGHDGWITAVGQDDGALRWRVPVGADVDGSAVVDEQGTIYIGADDGRVYAVDRDGEVTWTFATGRDIRSAIVRDADGMLLVGSYDHRLVSLDPRTGARRWVVQAEGAFAASVALDAAGTAFVGNRDRHLYAVAPTGEVRWRLEFPAEIDGTVEIGPDGTLYLGADDGVLRALR